MATLLGTRGGVDPATLYRECAAAGLRADPWLGKANSFAFGPGRDPGRGWVLLRYADLTALSAYTDHALAFEGAPGSRVTLSPITLLSYTCVSPGGTGDGQATFLCEVVDRRHHLARVPLPSGYAAYNVTAAAGGSYLADTLTGGVAWTWQQVVDDLATACGEDPTRFLLPFTPDATPQNLVFDGCSAWEALNRVLDRIACAPALDLTTDTFSVVRLGESQDTELSAITAPRLWDGYAGERARGWRPEKVRVRFLRRPQPTAGGSPYYTVDITLPAATGVVAGTFVWLDDDATASGASGTPSNSSALATRAQERADDWLRKRLYYDRPVLRAWRDFVPDAVGLAGAAVGRVVFDDTATQNRGAWQTWARAAPDGALERFRPLGDWPPWWPVAAGGTVADVSSGYASVTLAADNTWYDVPNLTVSVPQSGRYLLVASVPLSGRVTAGTPATIDMQFYNATDAAAVNLSRVLALNIPVTGQIIDQTVVMMAGFTASGAKTVNVQALRNSGSTWNYGPYAQLGTHGSTGWISCVRVGD